MVGCGCCKPGRVRVSVNRQTSVGWTAPVTVGSSRRERCGSSARGRGQVRSDVLALRMTMICIEKKKRILNALAAVELLSLSSLRGRCELACEILN